MKDDALYRLIDKYLKDQATVEEVKLIDEWYHSFDNHAGLTEQLTEEDKDGAVNESFSAVVQVLKLK